MVEPDWLLHWSTNMMALYEDRRLAKEELALCMNMDMGLSGMNEALLFAWTLIAWTMMQCVPDALGL